MGFFTRVSDIVTANINDLLDRMEDPEKMMKQLIREMETAVQEARDALINAIAHQRLVEKEIESHNQKIEEWQARALEAVKRDRDDLARNGGEDGEDDLPDDPTLLSYAVGAAAVLPPADRQRVLSARTTTERLRLVLALLRRERGMLDQLHAVPATGLLGTPISPN